MAFRIARVLEILIDGEWHTLEGVRRKTKVSRNQIQQIAEFLEEYEFVTLDEAKRRMRIGEAVRKFLAAEPTS